jgi:hypothetical protein
MRAIICTIAALSLISGLNFGPRLTKAAPQHYTASLMQPAIHSQAKTTVLLHRDGSRKPNLAHKGGSAQ